MLSKKITDFIEELRYKRREERLDEILDEGKTHPNKTKKIKDIIYKRY